MSALPEVLGLPVRVPDVTRGAPFVFDRIGPSIEAIRVALEFADAAKPPIAVARGAHLEDLQVEGTARVQEVAHQRVFGERVVDSRETRSCAVFRVSLPAGGPR